MSTITVIIKSGKDKHELSTTLETTIPQLKEQIAKELNVPADGQRLIYGGKMLKEGTLSELGVKDGNAIHLVKSKPAGTAAVNSTAANSSGPQTPAESVPAAPPLQAGRAAFDPLADLTSARYAGYGLPPLTSFLPQEGEGDLASMLDNPQVMQQMRRMLDDPQMREYMLQQMGPNAPPGMREMLDNPMMRDMLFNPEMMRMASQMRGSMPSFPAPGTAFPDPGQHVTGQNEQPVSGQPVSGQNEQPSQPANPFAQLFGNAPPTSPFGMDPELMQGIMASLGGNQQAQQDTRPPEERYEVQLRQLNDMGFFEFDRNVAALRRSGGSVQGAVEALLNGSV